MPDLIGLDKAGKDAVDEATKDLAALAAEIEPELTRAIDYLALKLQGLLVGRTITITIK